jgi:hypothetical protein
MLPMARAMLGAVKSMVIPELLRPSAAPVKGRRVPPARQVQGHG